MDSQVLCLGALARGPASGYEIKKQFEEGPFGYFYQVGFGSIYPALDRLLRAGLVTCTPSAQAKGPMKKIYQLTPAGEDAFRAALLADPGPDSVRSDFLFTMFFGHWLPADRVAQMIDAQVARYAETLAAMAGAGGAGQAGERFARGFATAVYQACKDYLEANRAALVAALPTTPARAAE